MELQVRNTDRLSALSSFESSRHTSGGYKNRPSLDVVAVDVTLTVSKLRVPYHATFPGTLFRDVCGRLESAEHQQQVLDIDHQLGSLSSVESFRYIAGGLRQTGVGTTYNPTT